MLATKDAKRVAREWADQQEDLPDGYYILARKYDWEKKGRYFTLQLSTITPPYKTPKIFGLLTILVGDDRAVEIIKDRRLFVRQMLMETNYEVDYALRHSTPASLDNIYSQAEAEKRLFEVIAAHKGQFPSKWCFGIREATEQEKAGGKVDAWYEIENRAATKVTVPIRVCVSRAAKADFFKSMPVTEGQRYIGILVTPSHSDELLVADMIKCLAHLRNNNLY